MVRSPVVVLACVACTHAPVPPTPAPSAWVQRFTEHEGVKIEYRVRNASGPDLPVVLIPGMSGSAGVYERNDALTAALGPRKLVAISLRGRGASDCPQTGWRPEDHHGDIRAVVEAEQLGRYHLVGHSMGVAYALGFALGRPSGEIVSLIAADYFPAVIEVSEEWAEMVESAAPPLSYDPRMARRVLREQGAADYADRLVELAMPILVILGTKSMEPQVEGQYAKAPDHRVLWIEHGHDTFSNAAAVAAAAAHLTRAEHR